jgi:diacylglycerol kinase
MPNAMIDLPKTVRSFRYAGRGVADLFWFENNAKVHLLAAVVVVSIGIWLKVSRIEWAIIITQIGLVFAAEAFNTALEKLCDLVQPTYHPQVKVIKDVASGAVLILAITAVIVAILIFIPKLCPANTLTT